MTIKLMIEAAAKARGINSQRELITYVEEKTGEKMRPATVSDMYRNNKTAINRDHLDTIMRAFGTTDFNEVMAIDITTKKDPAE